MKKNQTIQKGWNQALCCKRGFFQFSITIFILITTTYQIFNFRKGKEASRNQEIIFTETQESSSQNFPLSKPYFFVHIPKTGGTSLAKVVGQNFNSSEYWHIWAHPKPHQYKTLLTKSVVFGHFKWGIHKVFNHTNKYTYVTIFRHPYDRVISHYFYHRNTKGDKGHSLAKNLTLEQWVNISVDAHNDHVQFIAGIHGTPTEETFELAKRNLRTFGLVGFQEQFDESLIMMRHYLGLRNLRYRKTKVGRRPPAEAISAAAMAMIEKHNKMDMELYKIAQEMFQEQIKEIGEEVFKSELESFKKGFDSAGWQFTPRSDDENEKDLTRLKHFQMRQNYMPKNV